MRVELVVPEPRATRLVLTVQVHGFAVVGTYQPAEAERLADRLRDLARAAGHPLEVTTAARGTAKRRFRLQLQHWLTTRL